MRIAYLTSIYARASDTFIRNEVIELRRRGHSVHTFSIRREAQSAEVSDEIRSEQAGTDYVLEHPTLSLLLAFVLESLRAPARMAAMLALAWRIRAPGLRAMFKHCAYVVEAAYLAGRMRDLRIEVLHNHIAEASATVAMFASQLSGVPYSMTVHGPGIFYKPEQWALGEKVARSAFTACITAFCKSQCMLFAAPTIWHKLHIVRCGVGKSFEDVSPTPIPETPRIVFVGRLCAEKGLPLLVDAVASHVAAGGACELSLVGDGPLRSEVETLIERQGLQRNIRILGWKCSNEVRAEIERSRALVLPSFAEGLPVVVMESLALGRPVITTQIAGVPELVTHGVNGWLVPAGSTTALTEAIAEACAATPERLQAMGIDGVRRVRMRHHIATEVDRLELLLKSAVCSVPVQSIEESLRRTP